MDYFFHSSIKNYTIALLDMFSDIHLPRYNSSGDKIEDIIIPIKFGSKEKAYMLSEHDLENLHSGNVNTLPRMVLAFESMTKAQDRDTNKIHKINKRKLNDDPTSLIYEYHHNGVAYDFNYNIYIATRTFTDATIIVEQIAPMFRPDITLKIQEMDIQEKPTSVPVTLGDFNIELPEDMAEDEIRIIEVDFPLTLKGTLYMPIKEREIIEKLEVNMLVVEQARDSSAIKYEIEYPEEKEVLSSTITDESVEPLYPDDTLDILRAQEDSTVTIEHFDNNLPNDEG